MSTGLLSSRRAVKVIHALFWILFASIPFNFNVPLFGWQLALFRTLIPAFFMICLFYGHSYVVKKLLLQDSTTALLKLVVAYVVVIPICFFGIEFLFVKINNVNDVNITLTFEAWKDGDLVGISQTPNGVPRSVVGFMVMFMLFISFLYGLTQEVQQRTRKEAELRATNLRNELKLLRRQINPHFLFNALNNLYAIVQLEPNRAGDFVLKLADMLRYVTYDCQQERVLLDKEVSYLQNYLYFQQWRDNEFQQLEAQLPTDLPPVDIEPMLLLPFVENAFKHSYDPQHPQRRWIRLSLHLDDQGMLRFEITNSKSTTNTTEEVPDEYMGIGIENVRKRLSLLYPNQHQLLVEDNHDHYHILLTVQLSKVAATALS